MKQSINWIDQWISDSLGNSVLNRMTNNKVQS